jgi:hypothetical protein
MMAAGDVPRLPRPTQPPRADRTVLIVQATADRRRIYAVATDEHGESLGYGPLTLDQLNVRRLANPYQSVWPPAGSPDLAADIAAHPDAYHRLEAYFHVYGYPADVIAWIGSTPADGYDYREVAARLGLDEQRLWRAGLLEGETGGTDAASDTMFFPCLADNWAVTNMTGQVAVNPNALRFKAWLSLEITGMDS